MTSKFFRYPFADTGIKTTVPNDPQLDGSVSYNKGWTEDYTINPADDPAGKDFPLEQNNQLLYDVTLSLQQYQTWGTPDFITTTDNGGVLYPYSKYARTLFDDGVNGPQVFESLEAANDIEPGEAQSTWRYNDFSTQRLTIDAVQFKDSPVAGELVYYDSADGLFGLALADGTIKQRVVGFADPDYNRVIIAGEYIYAAGLTPGATYYLSTTTAGAMQTIRPAANVVQIGNARSATSLFMQIQTLPDAVLVASVYLAVSQAIPADNTPYKILFDTVDFDSGSMWDATNHRFVIPRDGYYELDGMAVMEPTAAGVGSVYLTLYKNNVTEFQRISQVFTSGEDAQPSGDVIVYAVAGDYFDLRASNDYTAIVDIAGAFQYNSFQISYLGE